MNNDTAAQVMVKDELRCKALLAADVESLAPLLSERLQFGHANAIYDDKKTLLEKMGSGKIVYKSLDVTGQKVVDLGDSALLFSRLTASVLVGGQPRHIDNWTLSVWVNESGEWLLIAYQPTPIPK